MNFNSFSKDFKKTYPDLCEKNFAYKSLDHSWIAIFQLPNDFKIKNQNSVNDNNNNNNNNYKTKVSKNLVLRLIINKFNFAVKSNIISEKTKLNIKIGDIVKHNISFSLSLEKEYYNDLIIHPSYTGKIIRWFPNGNIMSKGDYFNSEKNGMWLSWYDNGELHIKGHFIDNKKAGEFVEYSKIGTIYRKSNFVDDVLDGEYIVYHHNEKVKKRGNYKMGEKIGIWYYYDENENEKKCRIINNFDSPNNSDFFNDMDDVK